MGGGASAGFASAGGGRRGLAALASEPRARRRGHRRRRPGNSAATAATARRWRTLLDAPDAGVRYHVVQAAGKLGCLTRETLELLERSDADCADVRGPGLTKLLESSKSFNSFRSACSANRNDSHLTS